MVPSILANFTKICQVGCPDKGKISQLLLKFVISYTFMFPMVETV